LRGSFGWKTNTFAVATGCEDGQNDLEENVRPLERGDANCAKNGSASTARRNSGPRCAIATTAESRKCRSAAEMVGDDFTEAPHAPDRDSHPEGLNGLLELPVL
jgi:hypothetical protein